MKCPNCKEQALVLAERKGIEIDYCPECRGVWLDRGELDKILEKAASQEGSFIQSERSGKYEKEHYYKKRKSFLSELFD